MNCAVHKEIESTGYCSNCGKPVCAQCARQVRGALYCEPCLSSMLTQPATHQALAGRHPWVAFGLGWVPGLGAVYNSDYMKALVHVAIFAALVTMNAHGANQPFWGLVLAAFICYMPIEAYVAARDRFKTQRAADPAIQSTETPTTCLPVGPIVLIALGVLFLLDNFGVLQFDWVFERGWPVLLIGLGTWMLWKRRRRNS
jgi:hypothetical protein